MASSSSEFILSDYLMLEDVVVDNYQEFWSQQTTQTDQSSEKATSGDATSTTDNMHMKRENSGMKRKKEEVGQRVTFRTRSLLEVMDDGYRWRKYGKKTVKNSPNPRNYYKCSCEGCNVKKRVERDRDDSSYVLTTYDGVHNHETPSTTYYTQMPFQHSNHWALHPSSNSSSMQ